MRIGIQNISIAPRTWGSQAGLEGFLDHAGRTILLGKEVECANEFYSLSVCSEPDGETLCTVGLMCESQGLLPEALSLPDSELLFIGSNVSV